MLVKDIYHPNVKTIDQNIPIKEALNELMQFGVNGLIVIDDKNQVVGVLSAQDIAAATVPSQFRQNTQMAGAMYRKGFFTEMCQQIKDDPVSTIMRKEFMSVNLETNIMAITADFLKNDLYIVPVIENKNLIGIITRTEINKALASGMEIKTNHG